MAKQPLSITFPSNSADARGDRTPRAHSGNSILPVLVRLAIAIPSGELVRSGFLLLCFTLRSPSRSPS